jgi:hypothetical protein
MSERTRYFSDQELRLMTFAFRDSGLCRSLMVEFEQALDERIKLKLGLKAKAETMRDPTE